MRRLILFGVCIILMAGLQPLLPSVGTAAQRQDKAAEFELQDIDGQLHRLSDYRGKVIVLNFWASWCPECVEEMPSLNTLYEKYKGNDLVVLGISADRALESVKRLLSKTQVKYPLMLDTTGGALFRRYTIIGLPSTVVIDKNGFITERFIGNTDFSAPVVETKIEALMNQVQKR